MPHQAVSVVCWAPSRSREVAHAAACGRATWRACRDHWQPRALVPSNPQHVSPAISSVTQNTGGSDWEHVPQVANIAPVQRGSAEAVRCQMGLLSSATCNVIVTSKLMRTRLRRNDQLPVPIRQSTVIYEKIVKQPWFDSALRSFKLSCITPSIHSILVCQVANELWQSAIEHYLYFLQ